MTQTSTATQTYTTDQATDEAILMFVRRLHRLHPEAYAEVITSLSDDIRATLNQADVRADTLRAHDRAAGIARTYPEIYEDV